MTYIVAVSGGVDSVALLDMMIRAGRGPLVVAHFDHGIRSDSREDAEHVAALAEAYGLPFELGREDLGSDASEALARERRYAFLRAIADKYDGKIVTAHHADDVAESIAINLIRGTGWRGIAVMGADVMRPLMDMRKEDICTYAHKHGLKWREDSTNTSDAYLRNRIRPRVKALPDTHIDELRQLQQKQHVLKAHIEEEVSALVGNGPNYSRYLFAHIPKMAALECLRVLTKGMLTRPQLERTLLAVKTARPGAVFEAGTGISLRFTTRYFTV